MGKLTKEWLYAALIRALRTFCQSMLSMIAIGSAISEVNWAYVMSVSFVAAFLSICTSVVTGLPEAGDDGAILVDESQPGSVLYTIQCNEDPAVWSSKKAITLSVKHTNSPPNEDTDAKIDPKTDTDS